MVTCLACSIVTTLFIDDEGMNHRNIIEEDCEMWENNGNRNILILVMKFIYCQTFRFRSSWKDKLLAIFELQAQLEV